MQYRQSPAAQRRSFSSVESGPRGADFSDFSVLPSLGFGAGVEAGLAGAGVMAGVVAEAGAGRFEGGLLAGFVLRSFVGFDEFLRDESPGRFPYWTEVGKRPRSSSRCQYRLSKAKACWRSPVNSCSRLVY